MQFTSLCTRPLCFEGWKFEWMHHYIIWESTKSCKCCHGCKWRDIYLCIQLYTTTLHEGHFHKLHIIIGSVGPLTSCCSWHFGSQNWLVLCRHVGGKWLLFSCATRIVEWKRNDLDPTGHNRLATRSDCHMPPFQSNPHRTCTGYAGICDFHI